MRVLRRKLFNRGGYAHRGTGITSGLTPVQRFQGGGQATIRPEMLPAWTTFFSNLGTPTFKTGFGAISEDIRGAAKATAPVLAKAIAAGRGKERRIIKGADGYNYYADTGERVLPGIEKEKTGATFKDTEVDVLTKDKDDKFTIPDKLLRVFNEKTKEVEFLDRKGSKVEGDSFIYAPETDEAKVVNWSNPTTMDVLRKNNEGAFTVEDKITRTFKADENKFQYQDKTGAVLNSEDFIFSPGAATDTDETWKEEDVYLRSRTDENKVRKALRVFDQESKQLEYLDEKGQKIDMTDWVEYDVEQDQKKETAKSQIEGSITINGEKEPADFVQRGTEIFWMDNRPGSETIGQAISLKDIDGLDTYDLIPTVPKHVKSAQQIEGEIATELDLKEKYKMAGTYLTAIKEEAKIQNQRIKDNNAFKVFIDQSTAGTWAEGRNAFLKGLDTFGVDEYAPDLYKAFEKILKAGKIPPTEMIVALSASGTLGKALGWSQQLNRSELGILVDTGNQVFLTKEGQSLLAEFNLKDAEIKREAATLIDRLTPGDKNILEIQIEVTEFLNKSYDDFLNDPEIQRKIEIVKGYENVGDRSYFENLGKVQMTDDVVIDVGEAYKDKRVRFGGYPDSETGYFQYENGDEEYLINKQKPVYYVFSKEGAAFAKQL